MFIWKKACDAEHVKEKKRNDHDFSLSILCRRRAIFFFASARLSYFFVILSFFLVFSFNSIKIDFLFLLFAVLIAYHFLIYFMCLCVTQCIQRLAYAARLSLVHRLYTNIYIFLLLSRYTLCAAASITPKQMGMSSIRQFGFWFEISYLISN